MTEPVLIGRAGNAASPSYARRLHPTICEFTSEIFYEGRLGPRPGREVQALVGDTPFAGAALWLVPAEHAGNQSSAPEEVERVGEIVEGLLKGGVSWIDPHGKSVPLTRDHVLVVAPYNARNPANNSYSPTSLGQAKKRSPVVGALLGEPPCL